MPSTPAGVDAVAHRVVHGGERLRRAARRSTLRCARAIAALEPLAPLHNAPALAAIDEAMETLSRTCPHVAVFDTLFHASMPPEAREYAVPRRWREEWGVRRYGFHGLSVAWSAERAAALLGRPAADLRLVVCHLGGGCSVTAVARRTVARHDDGLLAARGRPDGDAVGIGRPGGAHLPGAQARDGRRRGRPRARPPSPGCSRLGGSADMRELEAAAGGGSEGARLAIDVFCHRVAGAVGVDGGRRRRARRGRLHRRHRRAAQPVRARRSRAARRARRGDRPGPQRRGRPAMATSAPPGSRAGVLVVSSREELIAARAARDVVGG